MTIQSCVGNCNVLNYTIAGAEYGNEFKRTQVLAILTIFVYSYSVLLRKPIGQCCYSGNWWLRQYVSAFHNFL